jgi:hypothetical protein
MSAGAELVEVQIVNQDDDEIRPLPIVAVTSNCHGKPSR